MTVSARLFENPASPALNTAAHAAEHCALDVRSLRELHAGRGRQVLVSSASGAVALYTVVAAIDRPEHELHAGAAGLARAGGEGDATIDADVTGPGPRPGVELTERLLGGDRGSGLAILAPHGGNIEPHTGEQAEWVYRALARRAMPVRAWIASGFDPAGAHRCWHITSSELSERSFPQLKRLFATGPRGAFAHAIAFHGHNDRDAIVVGGGLPGDGAHTALKERLAAAIGTELDAVTRDHPPVEVCLDGPLAGALAANIVNRVTAAGNGIQLEQPLAVRRDSAQREAVARAVAELYAELLAVSP